MSHTTQVQTALRHVPHMVAAAQKMKLEHKTGKHDVKLFQTTERGVDFSCQLPGWRYPVAVNSETGKVSMDTYNGEWGKMAEFDKFNQNYAESVAMEAAESLERDGFILDRAVASNGDIELVYTRE